MVKVKYIGSLPRMGDTVLGSDRVWSEDNGFVIAVPSEDAEAYLRHKGVFRQVREERMPKGGVYDERCMAREKRYKQIRQAVRQIDPRDEDHADESGLLRVEAVQEIMGDENLTEEELKLCLGTLSAKEGVAAARAAG